MTDKEYQITKWLTALLVALAIVWVVFMLAGAVFAFDNILNLEQAILSGGLEIHQVLHIEKD